MKTVHRYGQALRNEDGTYSFHFNDLKIFRESFAQIIGRGRKSVAIQLEIAQEQHPKSLSDLRYWKGPLLEVAFQCYHNLGFNLGSKEDAEFLLKSVFYYEEVELYPLGHIQRQPKSLKNISEEDLTNLIEKCQEFINTELGGNLMTKYDWAEMMDADTGLIVDKDTGEIL